MRGAKAGRIAQDLVLTAFECDRYASQRNHLSLSNAFAATGLGLPRRAVSQQLRPERIGATLVGPHRIDAASIRRIKEYTATGTVAVQTYSRCVGLDKVTTSKPRSGDTEKAADPLLFWFVNGDVIVIGVAGTARTAAGAFKAQLFLLIEHGVFGASDFIASLLTRS